MRATISILIGGDGRVQADVSGVEGHACITEILGKLAADLGGPSSTTLKPEFELDTEALALMQKMGIRV